jgi:hypothetical protein
MVAQVRGYKMPPDGLLLENRKRRFLSARAQDHTPRTSGRAFARAIATTQAVNMPNLCRVLRQSQFPASREFTREFAKFRRFLPLFHPIKAANRLAHQEVRQNSLFSVKTENCRAITGNIR